LCLKTDYKDKEEIEERLYFYKEKNDNTFFNIILRLLYYKKQMPFLSLEKIEMCVSYPNSKKLGISSFSKFFSK